MALFFFFFFYNLANGKKKFANKTRKSKRVRSKNTIIRSVQQILPSIARNECVVNSFLSSVRTCQTEPDVGQTTASAQSIKAITTYARTLILLISIFARHRSILRIDEWQNSEREKKEKEEGDGIKAANDYYRLALPR